MEDLDTKPEVNLSGEECSTQLYVCIDKEGGHAHNWNPAR
jgi:hypothetical protein